MSSAESPSNRAVLRAISALTGLQQSEVDEAFVRALESDTHPGTPTGDEYERVVARVKQSPLDHDDRAALLADLTESAVTLADITPAHAAAWHTILRESPVAIPTLDRRPVDLVDLPPELAAAIDVLLVLDQQVPQVWTLIGGLMVLVHCEERGVVPQRATTDADVAVSVFTHRDGLRAVTRLLEARGFDDRTPTPLAGDRQNSYRWVNGAVKVDVAIPEHANEEAEPPTTVDRRLGIELPALQQAIMRTQRVPVRIAGGEEGHVRRPHLLGALVLKAQAAVSDRRSPERHREDIVTLCGLAADDPMLTTYAAQVGRKDRRRLTDARKVLGPRDWSAADDPSSAKDALDVLIGDTKPL